MKTLYKIDNLDNIRVWTISVDSLGEISIEHGILNGQLINHTYQAQPKNIGKINETTPHEQALSEFESLIDKQIRLGYFHSLEDAEKNKDNFKAMKLEKAFELNNFGDLVKTKHYQKMPDQVLVQLKYNGVWCAVEKIDGELVFFSRGNTTFDYLKDSAIAQQLKNIPEGIKLIGEVYNHIYQESEVAGLVKRTKNFDENSNKMLNQLSFVIYDVWFNQVELNNQKYLDKLDYVESILPGFTATTSLIFKDDILDILHDVKMQGLEGCVIRSLDCKYEPGKRSKKVLKVKTFDTTDFDIENITLSDKEVVILHLLTKDGQGFTSTVNMSQELQKAIYSDRQSYINHRASVRHDGYTKYGIPKFPKTLEIIPADIKN